MTAMGAAIFGAISTLSLGNSHYIFANVLLGGLVVGGLEWLTLRLYRIPMGKIWCGAKAGMLLLLLGTMVGLDFGGAEGSFVLLPIFGFVLL